VTWVSSSFSTVGWTAGGSNLTLPEPTWAQLVPSTYTIYDIGVNTMITATEQYYDYANEDRPLVVPADSGYSSP
jgi:hypothetical protein